MHWKAGVCACQPRNEVIFPYPDGPLRYIYTVNMWGDQLVFNIFLSVIFLDSIRCLIIHTMYKWYVSSIGQMFHLFGVGFQYVAYGPTLEGLCYNCISIINIHNQYIFFPRLDVIGNFPVWSVYIL